MDFHVLLKICNGKNNADILIELGSKAKKKKKVGAVQDVAKLVQLT